ENYQILGVGDLNFDNIFKLNEPEKRINFSSLIYSKSFFTSSIIRNYLRETGLKKSDAMSNIKKYMQNIDESVFRKNLSAIDDYTRVIPRAIESVLEKEPFYELKKKCLFCTACNLTYRCHRPIFGIGNPDADTFIIKDRIEDTEDSQYKIIITKNISKFMKENNLDLHNTWITALLHCGSEDKNITINHYDTCILTHLKEHILLKKPKIIVLADHRAKKILMPYMKKIISEEKLMISLFGVQIGIRGMGHVA
ncbi:MAG: hypothetical protein Q7R95_02055, partial [bacterium]|nr:hypothetical protein [bacterium]